MFTLANAIDLFVQYGIIEYMFFQILFNNILNKFAFFSFINKLWAFCVFALFVLWGNPRDNFYKKKNISLCFYVQREENKHFNCMFCVQVSFAIQTTNKMYNQIEHVEIILLQNCSTLKV